MTPNQKRYAFNLFVLLLCVMNFLRCMMLQDIGNVKVTYG